jgi:predicted dehydrogenase
MRACVIGAGHISRQHLACLRTLPDVEIAGVCDLSPALAESAAEQFGAAKWYVEHREMLEDLQPDVVHIGTPPASHYSLAVDALEASAHTIVEKPITTRCEDLEKLIELAERRRCLLLEDHNYLFNHTIQRLLEWIASGAFGEVVHVDVVINLDILAEGSRMVDPNLPHPSLSLPGGAIAEFLTHMAYLSHAFVGAHRSLRTIWAKKSEGSPLPSDEFRALIDAERGTAMLSFSSHAQPDYFLVQAYGTKMRAEAHLFEPRIICERLLGGPKPLQPLGNGLLRARDEFRCAFASIRRKLGGGPGVYEGLWELLRRTYECITHGSSGPISLEEIKAVNTLVAALTDPANRA